MVVNFAADNASHFPVVTTATLDGSGHMQSGATAHKQIDFIVEWFE
jgi:hypothetical protein